LKGCGVVSDPVWGQAAMDRLSTALGNTFQRGPRTEFQTFVQCRTESLPYQIGHRKLPSRDFSQKYPDERRETREISLHAEFKGLFPNVSEQMRTTISAVNGGRERSTSNLHTMSFCCRVQHTDYCSEGVKARSAAIECALGSASR
jgi:hypothetical protein